MRQISNTLRGVVGEALAPLVVDGIGLRIISEFGWVIATVPASAHRDQTRSQRSSTGEHALPTR